MRDLRNYKKDETVSAVSMHMGPKAMKSLVEVLQKPKELGIQTLQLGITTSFTCIPNMNIELVLTYCSLQVNYIFLRNFEIWTAETNSKENLGVLLTSK